MEQLLADLIRPPAGLGWGATLARLAAAGVLGALIGLEREWRTKPAGLRTHILVALGACLFCLLTLELMAEARAAGEVARADPIRVIEAVTAGIAFLAAGTILTRGRDVTGITTGAGMWLAGAIGLACGLGQLGLAGLATALVLAVLIVLGRLERSARR